MKYILTLNPTVSYFTLSCRAVPTGFWLGGGGVFQNLGPLPFRKAKIFPDNVVGYVFVSSQNLSQNNIFPEISKIFSQQFLNFFKILQFQHARAPSPQVGPPFFTFFGGVTIPPPHPPRWHGKLLFSSMLLDKNFITA